MKNSQKGFANIILIVVILVILAIGGYFVLSRTMKPQLAPAGSQTPVSASETEYRFDYSGEDYGFEFNYPKTLTMARGQGSFNSETFFLEDPTSNLGIIGGIQLWVVPNQTTLDGFISKMMGNTQYTSSDENIAGISAKRLSVKDQQVSEGNQVFFVKDGYGYRWIGFRLRDIDGGLNMIPTLNNILSTFKFTK